jgi:hypothetical protein
LLERGVNAFTGIEIVELDVKEGIRPQNTSRGKVQTVITPMSKSTGTGELHDV